MRHCCTHRCRAWIRLDVPTKSIRSASHRTENLAGTTEKSGAVGPFGKAGRIDTISSHCGMLARLLKSCIFRTVSRGIIRSINIKDKMYKQLRLTSFDSNDYTTLKINYNIYRAILRTYILIQRTENTI